MAWSGMNGSKRTWPARTCTSSMTPAGRPSFQSTVNLPSPQRPHLQRQVEVAHAAVEEELLLLCRRRSYSTTHESRSGAASVSRTA